ncbi:MAG: hypothetical protein ABEJ65_09580, partial [bacterium]
PESSSGQGSSGSDGSGGQYVQQIKSLIEDNKKRLSSFDQNDNQKFEPDEINEAVKTLTEWAKDVAEGTGEWFYFREGDTKGPSSLSDIGSLLSDNPGTFVNKSGSESEVWVPYDILLKVANIISG